MSIRTSPIALASLLCAFVALGGCQDRFSTQEAYETCESITKHDQTSTDEEFADCVDCYERCGADCEDDGEEAPDIYVCPEDVDAE